MKISSFVDFETALSIVRELNINSVSEWRKWIKENKDKKLPYNPDIIYKNNGWVNFKHFFGTFTLKRKKFYTYDECRCFLKHISFKNHKEFIIWIKNNKDKGVPSNPEKVYKEKWISWGDFLSNDNISNSKKVFLEFLECKDYLSNLGLNGYKSFIKWYNIEKPNNIPNNPNIVYKDSWISWGDFLSTGNVSNSDKIFLNYNDCKKIVIEQKINSINMYIRWKDKPKNIPSKPDIIYKNKGWTTWSDFLGSLVISNKDKGQKYLDYQDAKDYLKKLDLNHKIDYLEYIINNNIDFLPKRPDYIYKKDWKGYLDYLNCIGLRSSYGEMKIKDFLEKNNIKYEREKKFEYCVNKNNNKLPFDFYLNDHNICIEYDGQHHFQIISKYGGEEFFKKVKDHDIIKNNWCLENNIKLIRIPYKKKNKIFKILSIELK